MGQFDIKKFQDLNLTEMAESIADLYLKVAKAAEELVNACYANESDIKKSSDKEPDFRIEFPIDIELIARYLGMKIEKKSLNREEPKSFSRILGIITTSQNGNAYVTIDNEVSYKTQRYTIANAVGRFLLNQAGTSLKCSYAIPLIPQSLEEIAADGIALFLLLPMKTFKQEFSNYLESCGDRPLDVDAWMMHLGNKSQISQFNLAIGYQQMKQALCYQRQSDFRESGFDINKMLDDPYDKIYA